MPTNTPVALEADLDQDACDEWIPVLYVRTPVAASPVAAQIALLGVAAALVGFLGPAPGWTPSIDLHRGTIALAPGDGRVDVAAGLALLEHFARTRVAACAA